MKATSVIGVIVLFVTVFSLCGFSVRQGPARASMDRGKAVFTKTCLACHQANGSGVPGLNPPLKKSKIVVGDKQTLVGILQNGLDEKIEVNGNTYDNPMPAQSSLTDQEIADVLTYVRNSFGNSADPVTVDEVKKWRKNG